jgi:hypothetical protein
MTTARGSDEGEDAVEIFELVIREKLLPATIDKLVPLSFIGQKAVNYYRDKIKLMDQLEMTEEQRKATLKDGQQAGELLLDIEARIGELYSKVPRRAKTTPMSSKTKLEEFSGARQTAKRKRFERAEKIYKNPAIVERVKKKAKEIDDIPTKGAVLSEISYEKEKARRKAAEKKQTKSRAIMTIEEKTYLNALQRCIRILPTSPPKNWSDSGLAEATAYAKIIKKRLEAF